ncbi:MAG: iron-containing alcohol dehydrogenase [Dehalococcoidales bacterium]
MSKTLSTIELLAHLWHKDVVVVTAGDSWEACGAQTDFGPVTNTVRVQVAPNPELRDIREASALIPACDYVLGVGGGSVMDTAKVLAGMHDKPLGLVPTTAGSGAEATPFATVYDEGTKLSMPCSTADHIVLEPRYLRSLDDYTAACAGVDALCQGIESEWSSLSTTLSRVYSIAAIDLCLKHLVPAVTDPTDYHRQGMLTAAHYSGLAIATAKTTVAHALSYSLTANYDIPHGHAVAMVMSRLLKIDNLAGPVTSEMFDSLMDEIGLDLELPEGAQALAKDVDQDRLANYPKPLSAGQLCWLLGGDVHEVPQA